LQTILLVEDEQELARVVERELSEAGYRVVHVTTGEAALERVGAGPDLVILDWMLPGIDGLEVLRQIRQTSPVPVLMLTARSQEIDRVVGLEVGADDYLTKPFGIRELIARVGALLRRIARVQQIVEADRAQQSAVRYGGLCLDPEARVATLDGNELSLSRIEYGLLHLLIRNPGRAFSRAYLLDAVWGEDYVAGDRSVDNVVLRLRKKLGPMEDAIETVWGVGYRLAPEEPEA
jgi:DNA-binding response OmpR family regulator